MSDLTEILEVTLESLNKRRNSIFKSIDAVRDSIHANNEAMTTLGKEHTEVDLKLEKIRAQIKQRDEKKRVYPDSKYDGDIFSLTSSSVVQCSPNCRNDRHMDDLSKIGLTFYTREDAERKLKSMQVRAAFDEGETDSESPLVGGFLSETEKSICAVIVPVQRKRHDEPFMVNIRTFEKIPVEIANTCQCPKCFDKNDD